MYCHTEEQRVGIPSSQEHRSLRMSAPSNLWLGFRWVFLSAFSQRPLLSHMKKLKLACPLFCSFPLEPNEIKAVILFCFIIAFQDDENCNFFVYWIFFFLQFVNVFI